MKYSKDKIIRKGVDESHLGKLIFSLVNAYDEAVPFEDRDENKKRKMIKDIIETIHGAIVDDVLDRMGGIESSNTMN